MTTIAGFGCQSALSRVQPPNPSRLTSTDMESKLERTPRPTVFNAFHFQTCFAPKRCTFFDISTSKSGPRTVCFVHVDFHMRFGPQRRALFPHLNFQKPPGRDSFFTLFISTCASRRNSVHFFEISNI